MFTSGASCCGSVFFQRLTDLLKRPSAAKVTLIDLGRDSFAVRQVWRSCSREVIEIVCFLFSLFLQGLLATSTTSALTLD